MSNWESWGNAPEDLAGTETFPINKAGHSRYTTINKIVAFLGAVFDAAGTAATAIAAHLTAVDHGPIVHSNRTALDLVSGTNTGDQDLSGLAPLNSPHLTGAPLAPTPGLGAYQTEIATMAAVYAVMNKGFRGQVTASGGLGEFFYQTPFNTFGVQKVGTGSYIITLTTIVGGETMNWQCPAVLAQLLDGHPGFITLSVGADGNGCAVVYVHTFNTSGAAADADFYITGQGSLGGSF